MSLLVRRPREVYRVYDELEYMSGAAGAECFAPNANEPTRRRGGAAAATAAMLVVGGTSVTLLAVHGSRAPGARRVAEARRSPALASLRHVGPASASRPRRDLVLTRSRPRRWIAAMPSEHRRRSSGRDLLHASRAPRRANAPVVRQPPQAQRAIAAAVRQALEGGTESPRSRRAEFGFER